MRRLSCSLIADLPFPLFQVCPISSSQSAAISVGPFISWCFPKSTSSCSVDLHSVNSSERIGVLSLGFEHLGGSLPVLQPLWLNFPF